MNQVTYTFITNPLNNVLKAAKLVVKTARARRLSHAIQQLVYGGHPRLVLLNRIKATLFWLEEEMRCNSVS